MTVVRESRTYPDIQFRRVVEAASWFYPNWSQDLADQLIEDFDLPRKKPIKKFSRGMMSAAGIVIGLAARAEVTILDEPYAGLDAVARQLFYDRLLADYAERPRTVLLSTHLIDEIGDLLEDVLVIDHGRLVMAGPVDEIRGSAVTVTGKADDVLSFASGQQILSREALAGRARVMLAGPLEAADLDRAERLGLVLEPVSLQQLVVSSSLGTDRGKVAS
jgi:ABC-2 type transport system ATP-binding protein